MISLLGCLAFGLLASLAPLGAEEQASTMPIFDLSTADAAVASGPLQQLGEDWSVTLGGAQPIQAKAGDVVGLRRKDVLIPGSPERDHVILLTGDHIPGPR